MTKKYGTDKGEDMMWKTIEAVSESVDEYMPEEHKRELMRKVYGEMSDGHYCEEFADEDISKMYYVDRSNVKHQAPYWPKSAVKEIYDTIRGDIRPYNFCDFNVTMNMVASDNWPLLEKWFPDMDGAERNAKTVEMAVNWLKDPDSRHPESKIWDYFE